MLATKTQNEQRGVIKVSRHGQSRKIKKASFIASAQGPEGPAHQIEFLTQSMTISCLGKVNAKSANEKECGKR